ncbi:hypothetical protein [Sphingopyxis sp.]|uniref:hypothetical protein n=1 Tax=Sphingopyxis sp. TaxID=1908224 RepID=UPI003D1253E1
MTDSVVVELIAGEGERRCLADKSLCLEMAPVEEGTDIAGSLILTSPTTGDVTTTPSLPYGPGNGEGLRLWPYLIAVPKGAEAESDGRSEYLVGVISEERSMYSGGGGSGGRLHLLRLNQSPDRLSLGDEVLDVVWDSSLMIRACFSEQDGKDRLGACHDEYRFKGSLTAAANDGGEFPSLTYRSVATAFPQTSRRSEDNSGQKLKKSDLADWKDTECSYQRVLRYNPATSRYEMDRPAPDCSDYTTP